MGAREIGLQRHRALCRGDGRPQLAGHHQGFAEGVQRISRVRPRRQRRPVMRNGPVPAAARREGDAEIGMGLGVIRPEFENPPVVAHPLFAIALRV